MPLELREINIISIDRPSILAGWTEYRLKDTDFYFQNLGETTGFYSKTQYIYSDIWLCWQSDKNFSHSQFLEKRLYTLFFGPRNQRVLSLNLIGGTFHYAVYKRWHFQARGKVAVNFHLMITWSDYIVNHRHIPTTEHLGKNRNHSPSNCSQSNVQVFHVYINHIPVCICPYVKLHESILFTFLYLFMSFVFVYDPICISFYTSLKLLCVSAPVLVLLAISLPLF